MNYVILIAIVVQGIITRVNRIAGAVVGFVITAGILIWGLGSYAGGGYITFFGIKLSQPAFLLVCLVWFGFDVNALVQARKHQAFESQLPATPAPAASPEAASGPALAVEGAEVAAPVVGASAGTVPLVVSWAGLGMAMDATIYVTLDGAPAGSGSFIDGFVLNLTTTAGAHEVGVKAGFRKTSVVVRAEEGKRYRVDLKYSRMSGKFTLETSES